MRAQNWIKAAALLSALVLAGCTTPTTTTTTTVAPPNNSETLLGANEVLTTITGIISDADGRPIAGATVTAGDGFASTMPVDQVIKTTETTTSRTIQTPTTDGQGYFEILIRNPGLDTTLGATGNTYAPVRLTYSGGGYYSRQILVNIPTFKTIRTAVGASEKPGTVGSTVVIKAAPTGSATGVLTVDTTVLPDVYGGYKLSMNLPRQALYKADAAITGTLLLKNFDATDSAATTPLASTQLRVEVKNSDGLLMGVVTGNTDATGKFTLTGIPRAKVSEGTMSIDSNSNDTISLLAAVKVDATATNLSSTESAYNWVSVTLGSLDLANSAVTAAAPYPFGTKVVVTNLPPKITAFSPNTSSVKMDPGTAVTRTPVVFTFNKTMNTTKSTLVKIYETSVSPANERTAYYTPALAWDTTSKVLTVTPSIAFKKNTTFVVQLVNFFDSEGVRLYKPSTTTDEDKSFTTVDGILFKTASFYDIYGIKQPVATNAAITVTFTATPVAYDTSATKLQKWTGSAWQDVASAISIVAASNQLSFVPAVNLAPNTNYQVIYTSLTSSLPDDTSITDANTAAPSLTTQTLTLKTKASVVPVLIGSSLLRYGQSGSTATPTSVTVADQAYAVSATIAPITLTFDVSLVNNSWATPVTLQDTGSTSNGTFVEGTVTIAGAVLTFTPKVRLEYNSTYTLSYTVYGGTDAESSTGAKTLTFTTDKPVTPSLVTSNTWTEGNLAMTTFPVSGTPITLTFDNAVAALNPDALAPLSATSIVLKRSGNTIPSTVTFDATSKIATLTPSGTLLYNTLYTVEYAVGAGYNSETITTKTLTFTTTKQQLAGTGTAGAPLFIVDPIKETALSVKHDTGASTFNALVEKVAGGTGVVYSWTTTGTETTVGYSADASVTPGTLTERTVGTATYWIVPITTTVLTGDTLKFRVRVTGATSTLPTPYSAALTLNDTVAPAVGSLSFAGAGGSTIAITNTLATWTDTVTNTTAVPVNHTVTISWALAENLKISVPVATSLVGVTFNATDIEKIYNLAGTLVTGVRLNFLISAGAPTTDPTGTVTFTLSDSDNNLIDADAVTAGAQTFTLSF